MAWSNAARLAAQQARHLHKGKIVETKQQAGRRITKEINQKQLQGHLKKMKTDKAYAKNYNKVYGPKAVAKNNAKVEAARAKFAKSGKIKMKGG